MKNVLSLNKQLVLAILVWSISIVYAQDPNAYKLKKADALLQSQKIDDALRLYQEVYYSNPNDVFYFQSYKNVLSQLNKHVELVSILKFYLLKHPNDYLNKSDLAFSYYKLDDRETAEKIWREILDSAGNNMAIYNQLSNSFMTLRLYSKAIDVYKKAQVELKNKSLFSLQIFRLHLFSNNHKEAFNEILSYLRTNPLQFNYVQKQILQMSEKNEAKIELINSLYLLDLDQTNEFQIALDIYYVNQHFDKIQEMVLKKQPKVFTAYFSFIAELIKLKEHQRVNEYLKQMMPLIVDKNERQNAEFLRVENSLELLLDSNFKTDSMRVTYEILVQSYIRHDNVKPQYLEKWIFYLLSKKQDYLSANDYLIQFSKIKMVNNDIMYSYKLLKARYHLSLRDFKNSRNYLSEIPDDYSNGAKLILLASIQMAENKHDELKESFSLLLNNPFRLKNKYINDFLEIFQYSNFFSDRKEMYSNLYYALTVFKYDSAIHIIQSTPVEDTLQNHILDRILFTIYDEIGKESLKHNLILLKKNAAYSDYWYYKEIEMSLKNRNPLLKQKMEAFLLKYPNSFWAAKVRQILHLEREQILNL